MMGEESVVDVCVRWGGGWIRLASGEGSSQDDVEARFKYRRRRGGESRTEKKRGRY